MADAMLVPSATSFAQDRVPALVASGTLPGWRRLEDVAVTSLRHMATSEVARAAMARAGVAWPQATGEVQGLVTGPANGHRDEGESSPSAESGELLAMRRHPEEAILIGTSGTRLDTLVAALAPGRHADAFATDLSDGMATIALEGPRLEAWLARVVDAMAIPRSPGTATRVRFADIAVLLLRLAPERIWLVVDRALAAYAGEWLTYAHAGAFAEPLEPLPRTSP